MSVMMRPIFFRLREVHGVYGDGTCEHEHRCSCTRTSSLHGGGVGVGGSGGGGAGNGGGGVFDDGMSNAWFPGVTGSVSIHDLRDTVSFGSGSSGDGKRVMVSIENGRHGAAVYRPWEGKKRPDSGVPLGAAASTQGEDDEDKAWEGYAHPPHRCPTCMEREDLRASLRREETEQEREERDRVFADVGLGLGSSMPSPASSQDESAGASSEVGSPIISELDLEDIDSAEEDEEEDGDVDVDGDGDGDGDEEWDMKKETESMLGPGGRVHAASPPAHDKRKLAMGKCDGIREILLFGEVRHSSFIWF